MPSSYVSKPLRTQDMAEADRLRLRKAREAIGLCPCGRGFKRSETEMCQHCEDDAQGGVIRAPVCPDCGESIDILDGCRCAWEYE